jgi:hypothetical protein
VSCVFKTIEATTKTKTTLALSDGSASYLLGFICKQQQQLALHKVQDN